MVEWHIPAERFLSHPILWGVFALVAFAVALVGKLSVNASTWVMWLACALASFGGYRLIIYFEWSLAISLLSTAALTCVFSIVTILTLRWLNEAAAPPAMPANKAALVENPLSTPLHAEANSITVTPAQPAPSAPVDTHKRLKAHPAPSLVPSVDVFYDEQSHTFNLINRGSSNIYLWLTKYGGDGSVKAKEIADESRTVTGNGGSYHLYGDSFEEKIRSEAVGGNLDIRVPYWLYITMDDKKQRVLKYQLWIRVINGVIKVETQNLGTEEKKFMQPQQ